MQATSRKPRRRKSYEDRTKSNTRAAITLAKATFAKPESIEDEDGNVMRVWQKNELQTYTNDMIATALSNRVAVEYNEMLGVIPPTAVKYCVTKGWLVTNPGKTLYRVTLKGAVELNLPMRFRGGSNHGRRIPFVLPERPATKA
jgi:hypothetical protein